jgi:hypothetical protein
VNPNLIAKLGARKERAGGCPPMREGATENSAGVVD